MEGRVIKFDRDDQGFEALRSGEAIVVTLLEHSEHAHVIPTRPLNIPLGDKPYTVAQTKQQYDTVEQAVFGAADFLLQKLRSQQRKAEEDKKSQDGLDDFFDL